MHEIMCFCGFSDTTALFTGIFPLGVAIGAVISFQTDAFIVRQGLGNFIPGSGELFTEFRVVKIHGCLLWFLLRPSGLVDVINIHAFIESLLMIEIFAFGIPIPNIGTPLVPAPSSALPIVIGGVFLDVSEGDEESALILFKTFGISVDKLLRSITDPTAI